MEKFITIEDVDSNENAAELKQGFIDALYQTRHKKREIDALVDALSTSGFFTSPCSGGYHLCVEGGLLVHSMNVMNYALKVGKALLTAEEFRTMKSSIVTCALLHDVGKIGDFGKKLYVPNILKSGKQSTSKPFERNKQLSNVPHAIRSIKFVKDFITLSEEEEWAILCHDGLYDFMRSELQGHETKLYLILHTADMYCARFFEVEATDDAEE